MNAMTNYSANLPLINPDGNFLSIGVNNVSVLETTIIEVANMAAIDYVFLTPVLNTCEPISDQNSLSLVLQLIDQLQLNLERTTFIAIEINDDNKSHFSRLDLKCVDQFPLELKRIPIVSCNHIDFIKTLHMYASSYSC